MRFSGFHLCSPLSTLIEGLRRHAGSVEALDLPSSSFDSVVDTFSLCVYSDPSKALQEIARVVKPEGQVLLLEHSRSTFSPLGWYQVRWRELLQQRMISGEVARVMLRKV